MPGDPARVLAGLAAQQGCRYVWRRWSIDLQKMTWKFRA